MRKAEEAKHDTSGPLIAVDPERLGRTLDDVEADYIAATVASLNGNKTAAATSLGIDRRTLYRKLKARGAR